MVNKPFFVSAEWDEEARVWVATSDDVPGLVAEDDSFENLILRIKVMIPELLSAKGHLVDNEIPFEILTRHFEIAHPAA